MLGTLSFGRLLAPAALALSFSLAAQAPTRADALDDATKTGTLRIAVVFDYPPFGFPGPDMKPQGFDIEFAGLLAKSINLKPELVSVTTTTKIPYIVTRRADVLFNIGYNDERAKVVDFSAPYAPYYIGVFGPPEIKVASIDDLADKSIAVARGSFEEIIVSRKAPSTAKIKRFEDDAGTITAFMSGQADLIAIGNIVASTLREQKPKRLPEQKLLLLNSPVRSAVLKGETRLLAKVNEGIAQLKKDGTLQAMALKWLKQPLPESF